MPKTMIAQIDPTGHSGSQDFARLVELQMKFSGLDVQLADLEAEMNANSLRALKHSATDYVVLQEERSRVETEIKALFAAHPEWRDDGQKSVKTPFGHVQQRSVSELDVPNPAMTIALIEARAARDAQFKADLYIKTEKSPKLEALEALSDDELSKLGVRRATSEKITVKPLKANVAKAVKAAKTEAQPKA